MLDLMFLNLTFFMLKIILGKVKGRSVPNDPTGAIKKNSWKQGAFRTMWFNRPGSKCNYINFRSTYQMMICIQIHLDTFIFCDSIKVFKDFINLLIQMCGSMK